MATKQLEKEIQLAICDYLALKHYFFWRQNTSPIFDKASGFYRPLPKYAMRGVSDIILIGKKGFVVFIEVKRQAGKLSEHQEAFKMLCDKWGATYLVVTSLDDIISYGL